MGCGRVEGHAWIVPFSQQCVLSPCVSITAPFFGSRLCRYRMYSQWKHHVNNTRVPCLITVRRHVSTDTRRIMRCVCLCLSVCECECCALHCSVSAVCVVLVLGLILNRIIVVVWYSYQLSVGMCMCMCVCVCVCVCLSVYAECCCWQCWRYV